MPARPAGQELGHEIGAADVQSPLRLRGRAAHRIQPCLTGLGPRPHHADGPAQPCEEGCGEMERDLNGRLSIHPLVGRKMTSN